MSRAGRVARIVLAPIIAYAALLVATSLALALSEALRGDLSAFHLNLVLSVSGVGRLFRQASPTGVAISQIVGEAGALSAVGPWLRREGTLRLMELDPDRTEFTLSGNDRPPLGRAGQVLDDALLARVARSTVRSLLRRFAKALEEG